jgi:hypothetical protein
MCPNRYKINQEMDLEAMKVIHVLFELIWGRDTSVAGKVTRTIAA